MFQIAVSVFSKFLVENDMQIILVVFDKKSKGIITFEEIHE